jgi:hypothetical protein
MKILLLGIFSILSLSAGAAQLVFSPDMIDITGTPSEDLITVKSDLTNTGDTDVTFYWSVVKPHDFPSLWQTQICDFILCYGENVDMINPELPNVIKAGETRDMKVYLLPHGMQGESSLELTLYADASLTNALVSLPTNSISISNSTSVIDDVDEGLILYPNPTTDYFKISEDTRVKTIVMSNIVGKVIKRFNHQEGQSHSVETLSNGIYILRLFDAKGEVIKALRLSKR